jgi:drug/metabolite transporter (DMT)-like permease
MLFLKERPKKKVIMGTLISLAGVLLIILQPILKEGLDGGLTGNVLFVASTIGGVIYTLLLKELLKKYEVIPVLFWTFTIAAITTMPFFLNEVHTYGFLPQLNIQGIVGIYFGVFFAATLAYLLFTYSLKILVANEVGLFTYIDPVIAVIIAVPLLGEKVNIIFLLGSVLVFGGIFISENRLHWHPFHLFKGE